MTHVFKTRRLIFGLVEDKEDRKDKYIDKKILVNRHKSALLKK